MFSRLFREKNPEHEMSQAEAVFPHIVDLVKDLDKPEFKKLMKAVEDVYDAYDGLRKVRTRDEKETEPVDELEASPATFIETTERKDG